MIVTAILIWLEIGAVVWLILDGLGYVENNFARAIAKGKTPTLGEMVLATIAMIVTWPWFVYVWARGAWRVSR